MIKQKGHPRSGKTERPGNTENFSPEVTTVFNRLTANDPAFHTRESSAADLLKLGPEGIKALCQAFMWSPVVSNVVRQTFNGTLIGKYNNLSKEEIKAIREFTKNMSKKSSRLNKYEKEGIEELKDFVESLEPSDLAENSFKPLREK